MGKQVGKVTHFYDKISVAIIKLTDSLKIGDTVKFSGHDQEFTQEVTSLQVEHENIEKAKKGQEVGLKTDQKVKVNDRVFLEE